jgi:hypothetical protein
VVKADPSAIPVMNVVLSGTMPLDDMYDLAANHLAASNQVGGNLAASSRLVNSQAAHKAAIAANKRLTRKALRPVRAAARSGDMTAANSAPNCAKVCARPKTYAATWARIVIWQTTSIGRFKV